MNRTQTVLVIVSAVGLLACDDRESTVAPVSDASVALVETDLRADRGTIDDRWAAISQTDVPGFAGIWFDRDTGEIVVSATSNESRTKARAWAQAWRARSDVPRAPIRFEVVAHDFMQLRTWKTTARQELLGRPDVVSLDADEVRNRLVIGVLPTAVRSDVRDAALRLDIPEAGLELVADSRLALERGVGAETTTGGSTLRSTVRPTMGGLQIEEQNNTGPCSLGFNAVLGGEPSGDYHFGTASHCSTSEYDPDTGYFQQDDAGPRVGRESHDLEPETGFYFFDSQAYDCSTKACRFSDVSLVEYDDSIDSGDIGLGRIARTTGSGSITLASPSYREVTQKRHHSTLWVGLGVVLVGQLSGHEEGSVSGTCVDRDFGSFDLLCQYTADYDSGGGDSGGTVYARVPGSSADVALVGTHVGSMGESPNHAIFSSLAGVEHDLLVTLDVCIPTGCESSPPASMDVDVDGDTDVPDNFTCPFTADVTGGVPPYTYQWFRDGDPVDPGGDEVEYEADTGNESFVLEVEVEDWENNTAISSEVAVSVSSSHPDCAGGTGN